MTRKRRDENFGDVGQRSSSWVGNLGETVVGHFLCYFSTNFCETMLVYRQYFRPFSLWIFQVRIPKVKVTVRQNWKIRSVTRICKLHDIVKIIAQYTLHTSCHRDNKPRHVQSMSLDVSTNNSVNGPSQVTIQGEGRPPCRVPLQVQF